MSYLKKEGFATSLGCTPGHDLWSSSNMSVEVTLTDKGLKNYEKVIELIFDYAHYIKDSGPQQYIFDEIQQIGKLNFEFQDEQSGLMYCQGISSKMQTMNLSNISEVLRSRYVIDEFDKEKNQDVINRLCDPSNLQIMLSAKGIETDSTEKWYGTKYKVEEVPYKLKESMKIPESRTKKFGLPPKNILIPQSTEIKPNHAEYSYVPKKLCYWSDADVWYKKDDKFERPKSIVSLKIYTPDCNLGKTIEANVFAEMWTEVMVEYLQEFLYMGATANLKFMAKPFQD